MHLSWSKAQTSQELELIYRPVPAGQKLLDLNELEAPICTRIKWQRKLLFVDELTEDGTDYTYELDQLQPNTKYACLMRTFGGGKEQHEARSELIYIQTPRDIPRPPKLAVTKKTDNALVLMMGNSEEPDYFVLNIYELPDNGTDIDQRNYCRQPAFMWTDRNAMRWRSRQEYDYEDCCAYQAELADDLRFIDEMQEMYRCSLDEPGNCEQSEEDTDEKLVQLKLAGNTTFYELRNLERYRKYSLQLQACNKIGCSSATIVNDRTNFTNGADLLTDLVACRVPNTMTYIMRFTEPEHPNGMIVNYALHYRRNVSDHVNETYLRCLTRRKHAEANFVNVAKLNGTFNECAVRVHSLAGDVMTPYMAINWCNEEQSKLETEPDFSEHHEVHSHARGISIFLLCFLFGCFVALIWILYKRRFWRICCQWPGLRHYVPVREQWLRERQQTEDREILVDGFETVRFQNNNNNSSNNNINSSNEEY